MTVWASTWMKELCKLSGSQLGVLLKSSTTCTWLLPLRLWENFDLCPFNPWRCCSGHWDALWWEKAASQKHVQNISEVRTEEPQTPKRTYHKGPTPSLVTNLSLPLWRKQIDERKHRVRAATPHAFWLDGSWQHFLNSAFAAAQFQVRTLQKILAEMRTHSYATIASTHHFLRRPTPWHKQRAVEPLCKGRNCCLENQTHRHIQKCCWHTMYVACVPVSGPHGESFECMTVAIRIACVYKVCVYKV